MRLLYGHFGELIDIGLLCGEQGGDYPASVVGEQPAVGASETQLAQTNKPIATKNTLRGLASGLTKGRCVLSVINRAPIGAAVSLPAKLYFAGNRFAALISARKITVCEEALFVFFVAIGLLV